MADPPDDVPYQSLYRRFRPSTFAEVRGQDHVVLALRNAVRDQRVAHAYLFSGPRGTGKTSTARILAKALNCTDLRDGEPCGECSSCLEITRGTSLDVHELDAASNNGVEAMRDLVSRAALGTPGRQKVYIVDEVHMLSTAASNALLKTLEEPPAHVIFVLATTDPQKVLPTIRSRTQHFEFRLLGPETLGELLDQVRRDAHLDVPDEALDLAVRRGRGSARDALSVLDQVAASDSVDDDLPELDEIVEALAERDVGRGLVAVAHLTAAGFSPQQLTGDLVEYLRQGFLALMARDLVTFSGTERDELATRAERVGLAALVRGMEVLGEAQVAMRDAPDPRVNLEVALIRLTHPEADDSPGALLARIERLEAAGRAQTPAPEGTRPAHGVAAGATASASASAGAAVAAVAAAPVAAAPVAAVTAPSAPAPASPAPASPEATAPAAHPGKGKKTIGAAIRGSAPSAGGADPGPAAQTSTEPPVPPGPPTGTTTAPAGAGGPRESAAAAPVNPESFPTRDQLVQAWGDHIIGRLRPKAKALFQAGRFVGVDGDRAVFGLPNDMHRTRCEDVRGDVEAALSEHFGQPVGLTLVVDPGRVEGPASTDGTSPDLAPAAPPAARPSSPGAQEGTDEPPVDPPPPPSASDPTGPEPPRRPNQDRHSGRPSGDEGQHQQDGEAGERDEEDDLSAFDESELGEIADIDNSAEARVLQAFPGAEEVL